MAEILVTGGAGFIGSELVHGLASNKDNHIVVLDNLITGSLEKLDLQQFENIKFVRGDVNQIDDLTAIFNQHNFEYVFHYAALVGVRRTMSNPLLVLNDISGIKEILNLSKNANVKRVLFSSSSEVYGEPVEIPQNEETTPLNSRLPYAIVKNIGEAYLRSYYTEFGLEYTIFRFFNTYGVKQSKDFVISKFIRAALKNEDITIYGDGHQTRTFCYVDDNIKCTLNALYNNELINDTINVGSADEIRIIDLAKLIIEMTNAKSKIVHLPPLKDGDMRRRKPDNKRMLELLQKEPISLQDGIRRIIENPQFILD